MNNNNCALFRACTDGHLDIVKKAVKQGEDINNKKNTLDKNALMLATQFGHTHIVKFLLDHGADIDTRDKEGHSPLTRALDNHRDDIAKLLIKKGAKLDIMIHAGRTALIYAVEKNNIEMARLLIESGADVNLANFHGETPYDIAIASIRIPMMFLFNKNIIHGQDELGNTLLIKKCIDRMYDVYTFNENDILFLHEKGADFYLENKSGKSALSYLMDNRALPDELISLREKLILELDVDDNDSTCLHL